MTLKYRLPSYKEQCSPFEEKSIEDQKDKLESDNKTTAFPLFPVCLVISKLCLFFPFLYHKRRRVNQ